MGRKRTKLTKRSVKSDDDNSSLPADLIMEILKRSPVKTVVTFLCVSHFWFNIIRSRYFMKLFLNESLTRPTNLVFVFKKPRLGSSALISSVDIKNMHEASSSSSSASASGSSASTFHVTCYSRQRTTITPSVHGLICYGPASSLVVYNPCTRRSVTLPKIKAGRRPINQYIGYDPIDGIYKVVCITRGMPELRNRRGSAEEVWVLTLGMMDSWRRMVGDIIPPHSPVSDELCINGVLYYQAFTGKKLNDSAIMSFDVRSEKLGLIKGPCTFPRYSMLTKYEGKLAVIFYEKKVSDIIGLWVLVDACKQEWSKKTFVLPNLADSHFLRFETFCTTDADTCELIFIPTYYVESSLCSVAYCDLEKNSVRRFEIERTTQQYRRHIYADSVSSSQVDNLMFL